MREAVVVLLPDVRGQAGSSATRSAAARAVPRHLQPLGVLAEHRIDDPDEGLVAVEEAVPPGQQIALEPCLRTDARSASSRSRDHPVRRNSSFVSVPRVPLSVRDLEDRAEQIRQRLVGTEDSEIALRLVSLRTTSRRKLPSTSVSCASTAPGEGTWTAWSREIRHVKIAQQQHRHWRADWRPSAGHPAGPVLPVPK